MERVLVEIQGAPLEGTLGEIDSDGYAQVYTDEGITLFVPVEKLKAVEKQPREGALVRTWEGATIKFWEGFEDGTYFQVGGSMALTWEELRILPHKIYFPEEEDE